MNFITRKIRNTIGAIPLSNRLGKALMPGSWIHALCGRNGRAERILVDIESLAGSLGEIAGRFEPHFIGLGDHLQTASEEALHLTGHTQSTIEVINGRNEDDLLGRVSKLAEAALAECNGCRTRMGGSLESIQVCVERLKALNGHTGAIEKIALVLRVIGLNIGVESSRSEEGRTMFGVVAKDVIALSQEIRETSSLLYRHAEEATQVQQDAYREVIGGFQEASKLADGAESSVREASAGVERLMSMAMTALENAEQHSRAISEQVGQVVGGIQFHDSMSQRLAHMVSALDALPRLCRLGPAGSNGRPGRGARLAEAAAVVRLQHTQLGQIVSDARAVHLESRAAFDTIYQKIDELVEGLVDFGSTQKAWSNGSGGDTDAFRNLLHALKRLHGLLKRSAAMRTRIHQALKEAGVSAGRLADQSATVRRVSHAIHILALNAIVKAAHMNERGRTLEVLAQEVRTLSHQANAFVDQYHHLLDDITAASGQQPEAGVGAADADGVGDQIGQGVEQIAAAYENFQAGAQRAVGAAEDLKQRIQIIQRDLEFFSDLDSVLSQHQSQMAAMRTELDRWVPKGDAEATSLVSQLSQRYTMQKERMVHSEVFDAIGADASPDTVQGADDGIELFETGTPEDRASAEPADLEGFEDFSVEADAMKRSAADDTENPQKAFDDNIELF